MCVFSLFLKAFLSKQMSSWKPFLFLLSFLFFAAFHIFLRFISLMRYVPENRKIMVISEDADNVMIFDEKFRVHTQVRCTLFVVFLFSL